MSEVTSATEGNAGPVVVVVIVVVAVVAVSVVDPAVDVEQLCCEDKISKYSLPDFSWVFAVLYMLRASITKVLTAAIFAVVPMLLSCVTIRSTSLITCVYWLMMVARSLQAKVDSWSLEPLEPSESESPVNTARSAASETLRSWLVSPLARNALTVAIWVVVRSLIDIVAAAVVPSVTAVNAGPVVDTSAKH